MKKIASLLVFLFLLTSCSDEQKNYKTGIYLLLDTSGTYTQELLKARDIINYILVQLEPGDSFVVARIDSGSFSEKDIIAKVALDSRPSTAGKQKRIFADQIDEFVKTVKSSAYTDISGGLIQAIEYLNEIDVGNKHIFIYSDLKEELPENYKRDVKLDFDGVTVRALNVTKLRSDNVDPQEYLDRVAHWQEKIESAGGSWGVVNDLERPDALAIKKD